MEPKPAISDGWVTRERALVVVLAVATAVAIYLCMTMTRPFLPALAWALALAIVARPLHEWIVARVPNGDAGAGLAVALVSALIVVPALAVGHQLGLEISQGIEQAQAGMEAGRWRSGLEGPRWLAPALRWIDQNLDLRGEVPRAIQGLMGNFSALLRGSVEAVVQLLLTLFILYFFFRDRREILRRVRALVPLSNLETDQVFLRVSDTVHATVYGTLLVALIQGALGGLMFFCLGLPGAFTWGAVMGILAVVPYLGAFVIWVPAALVLALDGNWGKAMILAAWGTIVVGLIDNLLYPVFVGQRLRMHTLLAFFAIVGGLAVFGASGIILGPVALAITIALVDVWERRTAEGRTAEEAVTS